VHKPAIPYSGFKPMYPIAYSDVSSSNTVPTSNKVTRLGEVRTKLPADRPTLLSDMNTVSTNESTRVYHPINTVSSTGFTPINAISKSNTIPLETYSICNSRPSTVYIILYLKVIFLQVVILYCQLNLWNHQNLKLETFIIRN